jgi:hypothetical protein
MMHRKLGMHAKARPMQTACLLLVVFSTIGLLVHAFANGGVSIAAAPAQTEQQSGHPRSAATPDLHPNAQTP